MSLILATGKDSSSSRPLQRRKHDRSDGETSDHKRLGLALAVSADQTLRALATLRPSSENEHVDLQITISPAAEPLNEFFPEMSCRLDFADHPTIDDEATTNNQDHSPDAHKLDPSLLFSSDSRFLACLVPSPDSQSGTIQIFHLSLALQSTQRTRPPPPSYIHDPLPAQETLSSIPVAAQEGSIASGMMLGKHRQISAMEDMTASCRRLEGGPSILLVACRDGSILGASYRPSAIAGVLHKPSDEERRHNVCHDIRQLKHCTEFNDSAGASIGKLAVLYADGSVQIFGTQQTETNGDKKSPSANGLAQSHSATESATDLFVTIDPIRRIQRQGAISAEWLCGSYLAIMRRQQSIAVVECYAVAEDGAERITTWELTAERLRDHRTSHAVAESMDCSVEWHHDVRPATLMYDPYSDCLAISGTIEAVASSFVCVWNWRSNVEGLFLAREYPLSILCFCRQASGRAKLVHLFSGLSVNSRCHADVYSAAHMSPRASRPISNGHLDLRERSNLLLSSESVSFPHVTRASAKREYEIEWRESALPIEYVHGHGAMRLATVGKCFGRSIAVASSHGFCTMDCSSASSNASSNLNRNVRRSPCRWRRFGKVAEEEAFSVRAFTWWEENNHRTKDMLRHEDLILAVIEARAIDSDDAGRYLSCWSPKALDLDHQLLFPVTSARWNRWGIPLPKDFEPGSMKLLRDPRDADCRKAILLIADDSMATKFRIYQLQLVSESLITNSECRDSLTEFVLVDCVSANEVGTPAHLFLASGFFGFDLEGKPPTTQSGFIATVAVLRYNPSTCVDALCVDSQNVVAVGQIFSDESVQSSANVCAIWQSDFLDRRTAGESCIVWLFQCTDGSTVSWFVPLACSSAASERLIEPMDDKDDTNSGKLACRALGVSAAAGKMTLWLHQSTSRPGKNLLLQTIPGSRYGCLLASGQGLRKFHRTIGEDFELERFRPNFLQHENFGPSDFVLSFPAFLPSYYSRLVDCAKAREARKGVWQTFCQLHTTIQSSVYQDIAFRSFQLLTSRLVEEVGALAKERKRHRATAWLLAAFVEFARDQLTPLQFASMFLEIGRQLEPCYFDSLFPLPNLSDDGDGETVLDLYDLSLDFGSTLAAASSLPLLDDSDALRQNCCRILRHCLDAIDAYFESFSGSGFCVVSEEQQVCGDVFRYLAKLDDAGIEVDDGNDTSDDDSIGSRNNNGNSRFSIFCGILGRSQVKGPSNGTVGGSFPALNGFGHVEIAPKDIGALIVGWYLVKFAIRQNRWTEAAAVSILLAGESTSGLTMCTIPCVIELVRQTRGSDMLSVLSMDDQTPRSLVEHFQTALTTCDAQLRSGDGARNLLDLVLILLGRSEAASKDCPGLLFIALVASWVGFRSGEFCRDGDLEDCKLLDAFQSAVSTLGGHKEC